MAYEKQAWSNFPDQNSPLTADRLNHMEEGIRLGNESNAGLTGTTPPSTTPTAIGIIYTRTTTGEAWRSVGTNSVDDWRPLSASSDFDIYHGSNPNILRPNQQGRANWWGTVQPNNWLDGDRWYDYAEIATGNPTPGDVPGGYTHRYEAADITLADGATLTTWGNRIQANPAFVGTGGVTFRNFNGLKRVSFDGVNDKMDAAIADITQPYTKVVLARYVTPVASRVLLGGTSGAANIASMSTGKISMTNGTTLAHTANVDAEWHLFTALSDGNTSAIAVGDSVVTGDAGSGPQTGLRLAANAGLSTYSNIEVALVLVYPRALTTAEGASIISYAKTIYPGTI